VAAADAPATAAAPVQTAAASPAATPVIELPPTAPKKKKQSFLRKIPGLGRSD
jgi:hypothetical protein